jgi:hypothetical protein
MKIIKGYAAQLFFRVSLVSLSIILVYPLFVNADEKKSAQSQVDIVETVVVENIEVPVRVFSGKDPVADLKKEDFQLLVDGQPAVINGFYKVRKKLTLKDSSIPQPGGEPAATTKPRLFVLIFNLYDYHQDLNSIMDYFFSKVVQPGDRVMAITNNYLFPEWTIQSPEITKKEILAILDKELTSLKSNLRFYENELKAQASKLKSEVTRLQMDEMSTPDLKKDFSDLITQQFSDFFLTYQLTLGDMRAEFLSLPLKRYIKVADYLRSQQADKWVFNFFQVGRIPMLRSVGEIQDKMDYYIDNNESPEKKDAGRRIRDLYHKYQSNMVFTEGDLVGDISKTFLNCGATFHTMLLKPINPGFIEDFKYRPVVTDAEVILKKLSRLTGGSIINSNKITAFVKKAVVKEDVVYMLTYVPAPGTNHRSSIKIEIPGKKYRVVYDDQKRAKAFASARKKVMDQGPGLQIEKIIFHDNRLTVKLNHINMVEYDGKSFGAVQTRIKIQGKGSKPVAKFERTYKGIKEVGVFHAELPLLAKGKYSIVLEVKDLFSLDNKYVGDAIKVNVK